MESEVWVLKLLCRVFRLYMLYMYTAMLISDMNKKKEKKGEHEQEKRMGNRVVVFSPRPLPLPRRRTDDIRRN